MRKYILIDGLYINQGGGLHLLKYLVSKLEETGVDFFLLADTRCIGYFKNVKLIQFLPATLKRRKRFYLQHKESFNCVFCFANLPPQIKLSVPVYTYFHNINLLTLKESLGITSWIKQYLKRLFFRLYKGNTNYWIVQTSNTAKELQSRLREDRSKVLEMPFYELPKGLLDLPLVAPKESRNDYVFIGDYYDGAKGHNELLDAWASLYSKGVRLTLHLTIDFSQNKICKRIEDMVERGVPIINHGAIPFTEVIKLYAISKASIYPSHNESLGLGIIESISAGCDLIGADLPFLHSICYPSNLFEPYSANSIAKAVLEYEKGIAKPAGIKIHNCIDELIELITDNCVH